MNDMATGSTTSLERVLIGGDLSQLKPDERVMYYKAVCDSVGLNPLTKPFEYITLNGKLTLYARRDATDQLRNINKVSITIKAREVIEDCYVVTAAAMTDVRQDESIGAVSIAGLKGEGRANAMMKAETKAKRRVTLSICGLGMLDETEVDSIPKAHITPTAGALDRMTPEQVVRIGAVVDKVTEWLNTGSVADALLEANNAEMDADEYTYFWTFFDSKQRRLMKAEDDRIREAQRVIENKTISSAMHKRLEARIKELHLDRDKVKAYCKEKFSVEHFTDLTPDQYSEVDSQLESMASAEPVLISPEEALSLEARCTENSIKLDTVKKFFKVALFGQLTAAQLVAAHEMIDETLTKRKEKEAA